jgi:endonuclease YncB( thermonuclease family)
MIRRIMPLALLGILFSLWLYGDQLWPAETVSGTSAAIRDGDTLVISNQTFRLFGMDAPEYHQSCTDAQGKEWPCGKIARTQLAALAARAAVTCEVHAQDKYNRSVATCGTGAVPDLSAAMVSAGLAISPAERGAAPYADEEANARVARKGIWQGPFVAPAVWRETHPRPQPVSGSVSNKPKAGND